MTGGRADGRGLDWAAGAAWLAPGREPRVLDAGCGAGGMAVQLAEAVGPAAQVVAVHGEPAAVAATSSLAAEHGPADRVEVVVGELPDAAAGAGPFDLLLASRVVHHLADETAGVRALAASLRPAGRLVLAEGGLPAAAARHHGWRRVLADTGLAEVGTRSFLLGVGPPLDADQPAYARGHLRDLLERLDGTLKEGNRRTLARLHRSQRPGRPRPP
jgi:SAM-dependent methyltransferase